MTTQSISVFQFQQSFDVRVQIINNEPWFCLRDVCAVLELNVRSSQAFGLDEKGMQKLCTPSNGGNQQLTYVNEPNLYRVIFRSNKPEAKLFQDWVFNEVLPTIRRTGSYTLPAPVEKREYLTNNDMLNLKRLVWLVSQQMKYKQSFVHAAWYCLREVTGVPSPARFEVQHLPAMAQEFERIMGIVKQYTDMQSDVEVNLIKHCIRHKNAAVLPRLLADLQKSATDAQMKIRLETDKVFSADCLALLNRKPAGSANYDDCNEPRPGLDDDLVSFRI